jgi:hypothetical protein
MEEDSVIKNILKYDDIWCKYLNIFNPYLDPYKVHFTPELPMYDITAYNKYPKHNFVYDKLWIAKTQDIQCGTLENISKRNNINYPIFIKPRWGHKSASSKNCFKIKKFDDVIPHLDKEEMIWTDFIDARETMTDFLMVNGKIMYQMTSIYSEKQNGFIDDWKYISQKNEPPKKIVDWVNKYMTNFSGVVNAQYRGEVIIEISLRLSRGGCYMKSADNPNIIKNINNIITENKWDYVLAKKMDYKPFYSYKCYTNMLIVYLFPQYLLDGMMSSYKCKTFYEYFFEPSGKWGMVFLQFLHEDFEKGMNCKKMIENLFNIIQLFFIIALLVFLYLLFGKKQYSKTIFVVILLVFLTRILNPLATNYSLYKAQKQQMF